MNLGLAKTLIKRRLGNPTNADILVIIEQEMALVQETVIEANGRIIPWFMETEIASVTAVPAEERVALPSDFVREKSDGGLFLYNASGETPWKKLTKVDYDQLLQEYQDAVGEPEKYSIGGIYFRLRPIPEVDAILKMFYTARAETPAGQTDDFTNIWLTHAADLLIAETAKSVAENIMQDFDLAASFATPIQRAWDRLNIDTTAREEEARSRNMGDPR